MRLVYIAAIALAVAAAGFSLTIALQQRDKACDVQEGLAQIEAVPDKAADVLEEPDATLQEDGETQQDEKPELEKTEPDIYIGLNEANRDGFVQVQSCRIDNEKNVVFSGYVKEKPVSDDNFFYLFERKMYDTELNQAGEYLDAVEKSRFFSLKTPVNENRPDSRLLSGFVVAVKLDGMYVPLCDPQYVTNPEELSSYTEAFPQPDSIKGILVDPARIRNSELDDLGVKHAAYNIFISNILGETSNPVYPTISFSYNGRNYRFNGQRIAEYDIVFSTLTRKGITISAILLNNHNGTQPQLIHPLSRGGYGNYYAFNTAEEDGIQTMAAVAAFLAKRYRDDTHGVVMNWIVGNEVNVRESWNYMQKVDLDTYSMEYAKAVRIFYNSIKSMNANARIYASMDQQWDRNLKNNPNYDVKDMLLSMSAQIKEEGDIDWGLAHHPYALPLTDTTFWSLGSPYKKLVQHSEDTSFVTMQNIEVITDFMQREEMLTDQGTIRPIILSELGYSSTQGEAQQAAAFVYAYYKAEADPHIDALILSRQTDAAAEVAQDLALGVTAVGGRRKYIYEVFKHIDGPQSAAVTEFAKSIIGIASWSEIGSAR